MRHLGGAQEAEIMPTGTRIGLDLVDVERFRLALTRHPQLEERLFTAGELEYCRGRATPELHLAARFAAKEAVGKLLGTGVLCWREIEVVRARPDGNVLADGAPGISLSGETARRAAQAGVCQIRVSLSHVDSHAGACVAAVACSSRRADDGR